MALRARVGHSLQDARAQTLPRLPLSLKMLHKPLNEIQGQLEDLVNVWELTLNQTATDIEVRSSKPGVRMRRVLRELAKKQT